MTARDPEPESLVRSYETLSGLDPTTTVVIFGAGPIAEKVRKRLRRSVDMIVDNNPALHGTDWHGLPIVSPMRLAASVGHVHVIICTTAIADVLEQLAGLRIQSPDDISIPTHLSEFLPIIELRSFTSDVLFTSGDAGTSTSDAVGGGGLFKASIPIDCDPVRILDGACHGIARYDDHWFVTSDEYGVAELDESLQMVESHSVQAGARPHGIAWCPDAGVFAVVATGRDSVLLFDSGFEPVSEIGLSSRLHDTGITQHHANDVWWDNGELFVSMFSRSGQWRRDVFDGCVAVLDRNRECLGDTLIGDLWMPHSVAVFDDSLFVLDSLRGNLVGNNRQVLGHFPGFMRGMDSRSGYFVIGQSQNRNSGRYLGVSDNVSIDTGLVVFDPRRHLSTTTLLPRSFSEIHSVVCL